MQQKPPSPEDQQRTIIAVVLSILALWAFSYFYPPFTPSEQPAQQTVAASQTQPEPKIAQEAPNVPVTRDEAVATASRIAIENSYIGGSISLKGVAFDDVYLKDYDVSLENEKPVQLLMPKGTDKPYYIETGFLTTDRGIQTPDASSIWTKVSTAPALTAQTPLILRWDNGQGLTFEKEITLDERYMFQVTNRVINNTSNDVTLVPYALINRRGHPEVGRQIMHEGPVAYIGDKLHEVDYDDLREDGDITLKNTQGWIGFTDKYWLAALTPDFERNYDYRFLSRNTQSGKALYQVDMRGDAVTARAGGQASVSEHFFTGAKELSTLNTYEKELGIKHFDLAIDFGWYYFLVKPFYMFLTELGHFFETFGFEVAFGMAILLFTVLVRGAMFPLANKSFRSMNMMKKLQPQIKEVKEKHEGDPMALQQAIMEIYKTEKVTPFSGCWPLLIQIPIFFALYKTLYISIDMRQAPFWGWVDDLSAPDPINIFTLGGIIPINMPDFFVVGLWPLLYGVSMTLQKRLNPTPADPIQESVMFWMPWLFTFIFSKLPAGLVIYFVWSNILGIAQQYYLQKKMGLNPSLFKRQTKEERNKAVMASDKFGAKKKVQDAVEVKDDKPKTPAKSKKKKASAKKKKSASKGKGNKKK